VDGALHPAKEVERGGQGDDKTAHPRGANPPELRVKTSLENKRAQGRPGARRTLGPCALRVAHYFVLPADRALLPPSLSQESDPAKTYRQRRGARTTRLLRPLQLRSSTRRQSVYRIPLPTSVTIPIRPLWRRDGDSPKSDTLGQVQSKILFREGMDRFSCATADLPIGQIS
jgi:hypothetical protein